jgi:hypothetical protein
MSNDVKSNGKGLNRKWHAPFSLFFFGHRENWANIEMMIDDF